MNITIKNVKNAIDLPDFVPVEGQWFLDDSSEETDRDDIEVSVKNWMDANFGIKVQIFHIDGREITSEIPSSGTFLATRI